MGERVEVEKKKGHVKARKVLVKRVKPKSEDIEQVELEKIDEKMKAKGSEIEEPVKDELREELLGLEDIDKLREELKVRETLIKVKDEIIERKDFEIEKKDEEIRDLKEEMARMKMDFLNREEVLIKREKELIEREDELRRQQYNLKKKELQQFPEIDEDVKKVLKILDALLEHLPEKVARDFIESPDFKLYEKVLDKYGI